MKRKMVAFFVVIASVICFVAFPTACSGEEKDENTYLFGSYPQSRVTNSRLTNALNVAAGTKPTSEDSYSWISYGYYSSGSNTTDYMWYQDVTYNEEEYRGVYFTSYRPHRTTDDSPTNDNTYQYANGYSLNAVYWFKYEPIKWRILEEENGYATLLCEMIIDGQEYYHLEETKTVGEETVYPNNYAESNIRRWLNGNFYETAFNESEQKIIQTVTVDNSVASTGYSSNPYACNDTEDRVWLLSYKEATELDNEKQTTEYARCQGVYVYKNTSSNYVGNSSWWLRSPGNSNSRFAVGISYYRGYGTCERISCTCGVVPALQIQLEK